MTSDQNTVKKLTFGIERIYNGLKVNASKFITCASNY